MSIHTDRDERHLFVEVDEEECWPEDTIFALLPEGLAKILLKLEKLAESVGGFHLTILDAHRYEEYQLTLKPEALGEALKLLRRLDHIDNRDRGIYMDVGEHYAVIIEREGPRLTVEVAVNTRPELTGSWDEPGGKEGVDETPEDLDEAFEDLEVLEEVEEDPGLECL